VIFIPRHGLLYNSNVHGLVEWDGRAAVWTRTILQAHETSAVKGVTTVKLCNTRALVLADGAVLGCKVHNDGRHVHPAYVRITTYDTTLLANGSLEYVDDLPSTFLP
jgi:hypothetical protein